MLLESAACPKSCNPYSCRARRALVELSSICPIESMDQSIAQNEVCLEVPPGQPAPPDCCGGVCPGLPGLEVGCHRHSLLDRLLLAEVLLLLVLFLIGPRCSSSLTWIVARIRMTIHSCACAIAWTIWRTTSSCCLGSRIQRFPCSRIVGCAGSCRTMWTWRWRGWRRRWRYMSAWNAAWRLAKTWWYPSQRYSS